MIPKILHFIWISKDFRCCDNTISDHHKQIIKQFKKNNPGYKVKIWTNKQCRKIANKLSRDNYYILTDKNTLLAQKTDILRMKILQLHGGIYNDLDIICIGSFNKLLKYDFFIGEERASCKEHMYDGRKRGRAVTNNMCYIVNGTIGAKKDHVLFRYYFDELDYTENKFRISYGPNLCEEILQQYKSQVGSDPKVVVLPEEYLYPYSYFEHPKDMKLTKNTICIHLYSGTSKDGK